MIAVFSKSPATIGVLLRWELLGNQYLAAKVVMEFVSLSLPQIWAEFSPSFLPTTAAALCFCA